MNASSAASSPSTTRPNVSISVADGELRLEGRTALAGLDPSVWSCAADPTGFGAVLNITLSQPSCYTEAPLGRLVGVQRFTSSARLRPYWVEPVSGQTPTEVRPETQWLLGERAGDYILIVPLLHERWRFALSGSATHVVVTGDTGDPFTVATGGMAVYVAQDADPFRLFERSAAAVLRIHGFGALRTEKPTPAFVDRFGWCTWDAFYHDVTPDKVLDGLRGFAAGGIAPRFVVLDDGWQSTRREWTGEQRLTSFAPNERFGRDLAPLIRAAKADYQVEHFLVWHAYLGYWGGLAEDLFVDYEPRTTPRSFAPGLLASEPNSNVAQWGALVGVPSARGAAAFFDHYHATLKRMGVDGVKVDSQATLEAISATRGGRVSLARAYRIALERSVAQHFNGQLINCMSCAPEHIYQSEKGVVMRTSDDFWPLRPESHGWHVFTNAHTALWYGEFMLPDWDMFQSDHSFGSFHAAARAVSGGPVYVSDKPGHHDFHLLAKLVLSDGSVLRADQPGRLTHDSLFYRPRERSVFKIFTRNHHTGFVGLFNGTPPTGGSGACGCTTRPADVPAFVTGRYAAFAHRAAELWTAEAAETREFELPSGEWELVTYVPIEKGFAAIGLANKFNSAGAISSFGWSSAEECSLHLRDGGTFVAWAEHPPVAVYFRGAVVAFSHHNYRLTCALPTGSAGTLIIRWSV